MKQVLVTEDGTLINPSQITTARRAIDRGGYEKDALAYFIGTKEIEAVQGQEHEQYVLRKAMREMLDKQFPKGRPEVGDYYKTQVRLSDGQVLWVGKELATVKFLMEQ